MTKLSNAEFVLLQIIAETAGVSGYEINKVVSVRGFGEWAGIGRSSLYNGLKKLAERALIRSHLDRDKVGKGPLPTVYSLTSKGKTTIRNAMVEALSATRERDIRYELALTGLQVLDPALAIDALTERIVFLKAEEAKLKAEHKRCRPCLPLGGEALFRHIFSSITSEIESVEDLIRLLRTS